MNAGYDMISPFSGEKKVMKAWDSGYNDFMLLDFSTGYFCLDRIFSLRDDKPASEENIFKTLTNQRSDSSRVNKEIEGRMWIPFSVAIGLGEETFSLDLDSSTGLWKISQYIPDDYLLETIYESSDFEPAYDYFLENYTNSDVYYFQEEE